jgi:hypothetical protein
VSEFFVKHEMVDSVIAHGATKSSVRLKCGIQADLRVVKDTEYPFALNYFTGSKEHNIIMRQRALARGWTLNEYRLGPVEQGKVTPQPIPEIRDEPELYKALGLDYVEPELREDHGEFGAAEAHELPKLIEVQNLRGTFHNHTTASDGRCTLREMAAAAQELGLQYLGIADHSKSSFQAHGLDEKRLLEQIEEIRTLNAEWKGDFRIFAGTEVDVLRDGALDFPDEILSQLDYVVASVHAVFNLPEAEMTARIIKAISNPHVTMLGPSHRAPSAPAGRIRRRRSGDHRCRGRNGNDHRAERKSLASGHGLALVAPREKKGSEVRDQSGCASHLATSSPLVWRRGGAERVAYQGRCGEHSRIRPDRESAGSEENALSGHFTLKRQVRECRRRCQGLIGVYQHSVRLHQLSCRAVPTLRQAAPTLCQAVPTLRRAVPTLRRAVTNSPSGCTNSPSSCTNSPSGCTNSPSGCTNSPSGCTNTPSGCTNSPSGCANSPSGCTDS